MLSIRANWISFEYSIESTTEVAVVLSAMVTLPRAGSPRAGEDFSKVRVAGDTNGIDMPDLIVANLVGSASTRTLAGSSFGASNGNLPMTHATEGGDGPPRQRSDCVVSGQSWE